MSYVIGGLDPAPFASLYGLSDAELSDHRAIRYRADSPTAFPCRVTLEDADVGESLLLVPYEHLPVDSPYRSSYALFVREGATQAAEHRDAVPDQLSRRLIALRAFSDDGLLLEADVVQGTALADMIEPWLDNPKVAYLHAYNAKYGCFLARIDRG